MGGGQQAHGHRVDAGLAEHLLYQGHDGFVRLLGVASAFQDAGVAALEAQREHVETHVGAGFEHDAYHTERHAYAAQAQSVGQGALQQGAAQGRGQERHLPHVGGDAPYPLGGEQEAVVEGTRRVHPVQVGLVGAQQGVALGLYPVGQGGQQAVAGVVAQQGQCVRRLSHLFKKGFVLHVAMD